jgi:hypothetical protein
MSLLKGIGNTLAPLIELVIREFMEKFLLPALKKADERAFRTVLVALYGPIDVYVEELVEKTETKVDDALVSGMMTAIENVAAENGVELPNLDED